MTATDPTGHMDDLDKTLLRDVDGWAHQVTDLDANVEVGTSELNRPVALTTRFSAVKDLLGTSVPNLTPGILAIAERSLSPRQPYQAAPLSYLNAGGRSWSLWGEADRLEWTEFGAPNARSGRLEFWFRNVVPGTTALVTLQLSVGTTGVGVTGTFDVASSAAAPRQFPVTGFRDHTVDLVVRATDAFGVLVSVEPRAGIGYFAFLSVTYRTL